LDSLNCLKIRYYYTNQNISVVQNCDLAIEHSKGEYICFIGDDDCLTRDTIDAVGWMKSNNIEVLISNKPKYIWPDVTYKNSGDRFSGTLVSNKYSGKFNNMISSRELIRNLKQGGQKIHDLPQLYHNIVKRSVLDKIYKETGTFFPGPSPDMAIAIALCAYVDNYKKIDYPLVISGKARGSVGGLGAHGKHVGEIKEISFLPKNTAETWSKGVPFYWSGSTIYADSVLKSLISTNNVKFINEFNYNYLYASCYMLDKYNKVRIDECVTNNKSANKLLISIYIIKLWINRLKIFIINRTKGLGKVVFYKNVLTIEQAVSTIEKQVENVKKPWSNSND